MTKFTSTFFSLILIICIMVKVAISTTTDATEGQRIKDRNMCQEKYHPGGKTFEEVTKEGNEANKDYIYCQVVADGTMDKDGNFDKDKLRTILKETDLTDKEIDEAVEECTQKKGTPEDTAFAHAKCIVSVDKKE